MAEMSIRGYAEHRKARGLPGGSPWSVQKALKDGRIVRNSAGKIDSDLADEQWARDTDPGKQHVESGGAGGGTVPSAPAYAKSRAIREAYAARMARLDYEKQTGALVSVSEVRAEQFRLGRLVRDKILAVPGRIAASLAAESDLKACETTLDAALREALEDLTG